MLGQRFSLHGALGRGGMATVYLAEELATGQRVALKLLHPHLTSDPGARRRLEREVDAAARLDHPGVLVARELFEADGQLGLVLPLHTGRTLAEVVAMDGPLPPDQVRRLGLRLAEALGHAHRAGVLHRDITPGNVLLDERGAPVLTDFGLARLQDQRTARSTTLLGTAGYVAPEVLSGQRADPRSDLYGLGAVLHFAATGRHAFAAAHPQAALQAQLQGEVPPLGAGVEGFPPWLDQAIRRLLHPDPDQRPQGAAAVVAALEEGRAPGPPPVTGPLPGASGRPVPARLPSGTWTVAVQESGDPDLRAARRALRRARRLGQEGHGELGRIIGQVSEVVGQVAGWSDAPTVEDRLAQAVGSAAGLPAGALQPAPALEARRFRLVAHVDRATADRLADDSRRLGLRASVLAEGDPSDPRSWLLSRWWVLIPLMWIAFPALMMVGAPDWTVFGMVAATVLLSALVGPLAARHRLPARVRRLPVAYTDDLSASLAAGFLPQQADAATAPARATDPAPPTRQSALLAAQAAAAVDELDAAVQAHHEDLPAPVSTDLRASARALRREVEELGAEAARLDAALAREAPADDGWAAERLGRLQTLARAGQPVDPTEQQRLQAAVQAHQAALVAEQALDAQRTATLARLLEIGATTRRLAHELTLDQVRARPPAQALEDLDRRAAAAAAARRELG